MERKLKGGIIINRFLRPKESVLQAEKMQKAFLSLGVDTDVVSDGYLHALITDNKTACDFNYDFVLYLDKDKYLAQMIENRGIRLFNSYKSIDVCSDKAQTYITLCKHGVPVPKTMFAPLSYMKDDKYTEEDYSGIEKNFSYPMIIKECYGSKGLTVHLVNNRCELESVLEELKNKPFLLQEYLGRYKGVDIRVIVIGGKVVSAIKRQNKNDFRSNVALGGVGEKIELNKDFKALSERVANLLGLDYCGIDIFIDEFNKPVICEVNSNAFFEETEKVKGINIASLYAKHIINSIK